MVEEKSETPFDSIVISPGEEGEEKVSVAINGTPDLPETDAPDLPETEFQSSDSEEQESFESSPPPLIVRKPSRKTAWLKWLTAGIVLAYGLYLLFGYAVVPYLVSSVLPNKLSVRMDRPMTIGSAEFNPFTNTLILRNGIIGPRLSIPDDRIDPILSFGSLMVDFEIVSFFRGGFICKEFSLEQFFLHLVRQPDFSYNIYELLPRVKVESLTDFPFSLNNIRITNSLLIFDDLPAEKTHTVENITVALPTLSNFSYKVAEYIRPELSAVVNKSPINVTGETEITSDSVDSRFRFEMEAVDLPSYFNYLPVNIGADLIGGKADIAVDLIFSTAKPVEERLQLEGIVTIQDARVGDGKGGTLASVSSMKLDGVFFPAIGRYYFREMVCDEPDLKIGRTKEGKWVLPAFIERWWQGQEAQASQKGGVTVDHFAVENGRLSLADQTVSAGYIDSLTDISLNIKGLKSPAAGGAQPAAFEMSGSLSRGDRAGMDTFDSSGFIELEPPHAEGTVNLRKLELAAYQPYLGGMFGGGRIKNGTANLAGRFAANRDADTGHLHLAIYDGDVTIQNLSLERADGPWLEAASVNSRQAGLDSSVPSLDFGKVQLTDGRLSLQIDQHGKVLLPPSIAAGDGEKKQDAHQDKKRAEWQKNLDSISADHVVAALTRSQKRTSGEIVEKRKAGNGKRELQVNLNDLFVQISEVPSQRQGKYKKQVAGSVQINKKGQISCLGPLSWPPLKAELDCNAKDLLLIDFASFFNEKVTGVTGGILQAKGLFKLPDYAFQGEVAVADFSLADKGKDVAAWQKATADDVKFSPVDGSFEIARLEMEEPTLQWIIAEDGRSNLHDIFSSRAESEKVQGDKSIFSIGAVSFSRGSLAIIDKSLIPTYSETVTINRWRTDSFTSRPGKPANVAAEGVLGSGAKVAIDGAWGFLTSGFFASGQLKISGYHLPLLSPYLEPQLGAVISGGSLAATIDFKQQGGKVEIQNHLVLNDFLIGKKRTDDTSLALAAAFLQQEDGQIVLDIPIYGDTRDPVSAYRKKVMQHLRSYQVKAAVTPFALAHDIFKEKETASQDASQIGQLSFPFGLADISDQNKIHLIRIARILNERPRLRMKIKGAADAKGDSEAIISSHRQEITYRQVVDEIRMSETISQAYGKEEIKSPAAGKRNAVPDTPPKSPAAIVVKDSDLIELARKRTIAVQQYLVEVFNIPADRLIIDKEVTLVAGDAAGRPGNRVEFIPESTL